MLFRLQPTEAVATSTVAATRARDFSLMARGSLREARARRPGVYWGENVYCASRYRARTGRRQRSRRGANRDAAMSAERAAASTSLGDAAVSHHHALDALARRGQKKNR